MEQGFLTSDGEFLSRKDAYVHAKWHGQLAPKVIEERENQETLTLFSEDIW